MESAQDRLHTLIDKLGKRQDPDWHPTTAQMLACGFEKRDSGYTEQVGTATMPVMIWVDPEQDEHFEGTRAYIYCRTEPA